MKLHHDVDLKTLYDVMKEFQSTIYQTPPLKSAVKRRLRKRNVYSIIPLEVEDRKILFKTQVEAGTYIRKLCFDLGEALGSGINLVELRRIKSGIFSESDTITLNKLAYSALLYRENNDPSVLRELIKPVEDILVDKELVIVKQSAKKNLYSGAPLSVRGVICLSENIKKGDEVFICTQDGELVEVARVLRDANELQNMTNGIIANPIRVLEPITTD
jgi:H/ACA ribonucleoprotein complex subunit 4